MLFASFPPIRDPPPLQSDLRDGRLPEPSVTTGLLPPGGERHMTLLPLNTRLSTKSGRRYRRSEVRIVGNTLPDPSLRGGFRFTFFVFSVCPFTFRWGSGVSCTHLRAWGRQEDSWDTVWRRRRLQKEDVDTVHRPRPRSFCSTSRNRRSPQNRVCPPCSVRVRLCLFLHRVSPLTHGTLGT